MAEVDEYAVLLDNLGNKMAQRKISSVNFYLRYFVQGSILTEVGSDIQNLIYQNLPTVDGILKFFESTIEICFGHTY